MDQNTLNLYPDPEFWLNLDTNPITDPDPDQLRKKVIKVLEENKFPFFPLSL